MILGCPSRASSDVTRADLGLQLLSSRRDNAKLKWQQRLHGFSADRLERVLYDRGLEAPARGRGRNRRMWSQIVGSIWDTLSEFSVESISLPCKEFERELCTAVHDRDQAAFLCALAGKPELTLYQRIYEGPGFKEDLQCSAQGQQATQIRFQLHCGTSMLRQHDSRFRDQPNHDREDRVCPTCEEPDSIESIQHVLLHCPAYEHHRAALRSVVASLPGAQDSTPVLADDEGLIALLRDDFMGGAEEAVLAADAFLHAVITFRNHYVEQFGG